MSSSTSTQPAPPTATSSAPPAQTLPQTKPPVTIHPTAHLDPGAYVRGTHAISLDANVLVHPRAQLISLHGPLIIGAGTVVYEKAVLGGPIPIPSTSSTSSSTPATAALSTQKPALDGSEADPDASPDPELDPQKTLVGTNVTIHPHALIHAGATLSDCSTIDSHATISASTTVGAHAKVCAGCAVDRDVGAWEVVFGDGRQRRQRPETGGPPGREVVEKARLKALAVDREMTTATLRAAARAGVRKK